MIKFIILNATLCSIMAAQTTIKIYNQGRALVQEERQKKFSQEGKQKLIISKIPHAAESSSINISSDNMEVISKEYLYLPISNENILNANIGNEIELVKYGENGSITFSTKGKLISNVTNPVFEIDGKIVINPPYNYRFSEIPNDITRETPASFEPTLDYCVVKIPRWPFDKFRTADRTLGTSMKSTGEVMAIGRCFEEAFLKAWASLEQGTHYPRPLTRADESEGEGMEERANEELPDTVLVDWLRVATDRRIGAVIEAFRRGWSIEKVHEITRITRWFLYGFQSIASIEAEMVEFAKSPSEIGKTLFNKLSN